MHLKLHLIYNAFHLFLFVALIYRSRTATLSVAFVRAAVHHQPRCCSRTANRLQLCKYTNKRAKKCQAGLNIFLSECSYIRVPQIYKIKGRFANFIGPKTGEMIGLVLWTKYVEMLADGEISVFLLLLFVWCQKRV